MKTKKILHNKFTNKMLCFLFFFFAFFSTKAQLLSPNQPEQDACNAIDLCGNTFTTPYSYQGRGNVYDLPATPCGLGEDNSVWLKVTIATSGKLVFLIKPIDVQDDYDFAVVKNNGDCSAISSSEVLRCNFNNNQRGSNVDGVVGLSLTSNLPYVQSGTTGSSFSQAIDAVAGDVYYVMVNNFGYGAGPSLGFTIDFSGSTASFANTTIPLLQNLISSCDYTKSVDIHLSNYALCSSIASDASDFELTNTNGQQFPLISANGVNCTGTVGYARDIHVEFQNNLPNGDYILKAKKGSDGNSILGLCGGETPDNSQTIQFSIKTDTLKLVTIDSPACQIIRLLFDQTIACISIKRDGSQFFVTGPSPVSVTAAQPLSTCNSNATTGIQLTLNQPIEIDEQYVLHSVEDNSIYGTCNSILFKDVNRAFYVNSFNGLLNTFPDTTVCAIDDQIQITTTNNAPTPNGGFQYQWTENNQALPINQLSPRVTIDNPANHYLVKTVDANGCVLRDTTNIKVETFIGSVTPSQASICLNDSLQLEASDNAVIYQWYSDALVKTLTNNTFSSNSISNPIYYPDSVGNFTYYALLTSSKQCQDTLSVNIEVKRLPDLVVAYNDTVINYGNNIQLLSDGASYYKWTPTISLLNPTIPNPIAHPIITTTYKVIGTNDIGCSVVDTVRVNIFFEDYAYFPTGFTPNQDGRNDVFRAHFFGKINQFSLNIFNRWGQKIFSSNDPEQGWNGMIGNHPAAAGTYIWDCTYYPDGQKQYNKKGTVVLIR
ncbi:MAG: hypothetical protein DI598_06475 [Pseudopedobacter saltans]|uniref:Ig-like domain-containing protein n=1 Tax=Pseudopedobacter saltans TaxID=151895 RepID=A0A2W5F8N4_9SPHI|nr:MAG: hypothetical protein DI598_06475 [Pseudopedobacter saltans]